MMGTKGMPVIGEKGIEIIPITEEETGTLFQCIHFEHKYCGYDSSENVLDYLRRGEKIRNLLREKQKKQSCSVLGEKDWILELVKQDWPHTKNAVAKKIGEELRQNFLSHTADEKQACDELMLVLPVGVSISVEKSQYMHNLMKVVCKTDTDSILHILQLKVGDESYYSCVDVGNIRKVHERGVRLRGSREAYKKVVGFNALIAEFYVRRHVLDLLRGIRQSAGTFEKYLQIPAVGSLVAKYVKTLDFYALDDVMKIPDAGRRNLSVLLLHPESQQAEKVVLLLAGMDLNSILIQLSQDYATQIAESKMERHLSGEYAHSYETKKNIPEKCVRAMAKSGFNDFFGYVEFDEECDLQLLEEIEKEFRAVAAEVGLLRNPEVSLRFRKLGQHKASGLYYNRLKCICVDVRYPGSMMHEIGHMIDYEMGHISDTYSFMEIRNRYTHLLILLLETSDSKTVNRIKGRSKYNLSYYLLPSEIFARCFEMYLVWHRGIDNSICRPLGFGYPEDEELKRLVFAYFDQIFHNIDAGERKEQVVDAAQ